MFLKGKSILFNVHVTEINSLDHPVFRNELTFIMCFELSELVFVVELLNVLVVCNSNMILKCKCVFQMPNLVFMCLRKVARAFCGKRERSRIYNITALKALCETVLTEYEFS